MSKKLILVLVLAFFFFKFNLAQAEVVINEIAWMGTSVSANNEWLELYNTGSSSVNLAGWVLKATSGTPTITLSGTIPANGFYLLERTNDDTVLGITADNIYTGALSNSGAIMVLNNASGAEIDRVDGSNNWQIGGSQTIGDNTTKQTAQRTSGGSWITSSPTPKAVIPSFSPVGGGSLLEENSNDNTSNTTSNSSTTTTEETKTKIAEISKIKTKITGKTLGFAGLPLSFQGTAFGLEGESLFFGKYFWNFGDCDSKEIQAIDNRQFTHTYFYPGEYIVSLDYFQNYYSDVPDASDQITIKIIPADILISRVGDEKDFFVELRNNTDYTADLSNWILTSDRKSFTIPRNTVLATEKTITISPRITNFSIEDKNTLKLMTPQQEIAFDYTASVVPVKTTTPSIPPPKGEVKNSSLPDLTSPSAPLSLSRRGVGGEVNFEVAPASVPDNQPPADNLTASVAESDVVDSKNSRTIIIFAIFIIFIGISASVVYFVRSKGDIFRHGNDFKILDE